MPEDLGPLCSAFGCTKTARMAVALSRPSRERMYATVDFDDREAPKKAIRYCRQHGGEVVLDLIATLTEQDE